MPLEIFATCDFFLVTRHPILVSSHGTPQSHFLVVGLGLALVANPRFSEFVGNALVVWFWSLHGCIQ